MVERSIESHSWSSTCWRIAGEVQASGILETMDGMPDTRRFPQIGSLSTWQWEVLSRLLRGERVPTIARELVVSQSTVRNYPERDLREVRRPLTGRIVGCVDETGPLPSLSGPLCFPLSSSVALWNSVPRGSPVRRLFRDPQSGTGRFAARGPRSVRAHLGSADPLAPGVRMSADCP